VWWKCDRGPDHEWQAQVRSRTIRGVRCPFCTHRRVAISQSIAVTHAEVSAQWHPTKNGDRSPEMFTFGSHHEAWWQCPDYKTHVWQAHIASRTVMLAGCPACARLAGKGSRPKGNLDPQGVVVDLGETVRTHQITSDLRSGAPGRK